MSERASETLGGKEGREGGERGGSTDPPSPDPNERKELKNEH